MTQKTIKTQTINYKKFPCPTCKQKGQYTTDKQGNKYCTHCGTIIDSPYPYDAGIRHYTISDYLIQYKNERMVKKWKKTTSPHMQLG